MKPRRKAWMATGDCAAQESLSAGASPSAGASLEIGVLHECEAAQLQRKTAARVMASPRQPSLTGRR